MYADRLTAYEEPFEFPAATLHKVIRWEFEKQGSFPYPPPMPDDPPIITEGKPPKIDIFIGGNGEYDFNEDYSNSSDIWNRINPDGISTHEAPQVNAVNYA